MIYFISFILLFLNLGNNYTLNRNFFPNNELLTAKYLKEIIADQFKELPPDQFKKIPA